MGGNRRSFRIPEYDYSQPGAYFVTICTQGRRCLFGDIKEGQMQLNEFGQIISKNWLALPTRFPHITLDEFVVMPNHLHGVVFFNYPLASLGQMVAYFKYLTTRGVNDKIGLSGAPLWQRNYYEHVIRNEKDMNRIREYIFNNPLQWHFDQENPQYNHPS